MLTIVRHIKHSCAAGRLIIILALSFYFLPNNLSAQSTRESVVLLDIKPDMVLLELQVPLPELTSALGRTLVTDPDALLKQSGEAISSYFVQHVRAESGLDKPWTTEVQTLTIGNSIQNGGGSHRELTATVLILPPSGQNTREFRLHYNVILHSANTHSARFYVRQDWDGGLITNEPIQLGLISGNQQPYIDIKLNGSKWMGFTAMMRMGFGHVARGTDDLLFLVLMLIPVTVISLSSRWSTPVSTRVVVKRTLGIALAITLGHCLSLLAAAVNGFRLPPSIMAIAVALLLLLMAVHALWPIIRGKENLFIFLFAVLHGLAFSATLPNLHLDSGRNALSMLGFNTGVQFMQLFVMATTIPSLIILSRSSLFSYTRLTLALPAITTAIAWIVETLTTKPNIVTRLLFDSAGYGLYLVVILAVVALFSLLTKQKKVASASLMLEN
ncbi:hypothetical protein EXU57_14400 [Segetibacter sp. 3557_3]|uniref:HupE/UreJ family protein n=1 Tax=Segetibacter sp. 3557_3 TaxID=2547429 RepID=UPI001058A0FF|nr:HupE/UreJ family protein [Segetibacter sp. 3557_3]TDH24533.1 hypothetical protein EXU57_14400 [Segetibacter sp. 3557_3]